MEFTGSIGNPTEEFIRLANSFKNIIYNDFFYHNHNVTINIVFEDTTVKVLVSATERPDTVEICIRGLFDGAEGITFHIPTSELAGKERANYVVVISELVPQGIMAAFDEYREYLSQARRSADT